MSKCDHNIDIPSGGTEIEGVVYCGIFGAVAADTCAGCPMYAGESRGVGDTIEKVINAIGIPKPKGCGCDKRKAKLNKLFPYKKD